MCYQTQRYAMYEANQLVFETSQVRPASCSELHCARPVLQRPLSVPCFCSLSLPCTVKFDDLKSDLLSCRILQVMPDIPYGDCFTVEARWDITEVIIL
jgi:hypothetical protein